MDRAMIIHGHALCSAASSHSWIASYPTVAKKTDTTSSDIDLMVIADDLSYGALFTAVENASVTLGRPVTWPLEISTGQAGSIPASGTTLNCRRYPINRGYPFTSVLFDYPSSAHPTHSQTPACQTD